MIEYAITGGDGGVGGQTSKRCNHSVKLMPRYTRTVTKTSVISLTIITTCLLVNCYVLSYNEFNKIVYFTKALLFLQVRQSDQKLFPTFYICK